MSRAGILILLGILTILTPFSGLPIAIRSLFAVIFGACVFGIGLSLRVHQVPSAQMPVKTSTPEAVIPPGVSPI